MKILVKEILRGSELTANPSDIIIVNDELGKLLINAKVAEEIKEEIKELKEEINEHSKPPKKR